MIDGFLANWRAQHYYETQSQWSDVLPHSTKHSDRQEVYDVLKLLPIINEVDIQRVFDRILSRPGTHSIGRKPITFQCDLCREEVAGLCEIQLDGFGLCFCAPCLEKMAISVRVHASGVSESIPNVP
jgi:hypothetical protein